MAVAMTERWLRCTIPQQTPLSPLRGQLPSRGAFFIGRCAGPKASPGGEVPPQAAERWPPARSPTTEARFDMFRLLENSCMSSHFRVY